MLAEDPMTQPPRDERPTPEIQPNTLSEPPRAGRRDVAANRLSSVRATGARARLPGVSGRTSAIVLLVLFVVVAVVLPLALHRSAWVEAEIVVLAWFAIWTAVLAWMGYGGRSVEKDWTPFVAPRRGSSSGGGSFGDGGWSFPTLGDGDLGTDILGALVAIVLIAALAVLLYFTIGYLIPLVAIGLYTLVRTMLNQVAARGPGTQGDLAGSLGRAVVWAAIYTAPLALLIWLVHVVF
jgi:hypothetical protein